MNAYEKEQTCRYEGIYTPEEAVLNQRLYEACAKEKIESAEIETLLKQGADPTGALAVSGWDLLLHVYGEIALDSEDTDNENLPCITELFLKYGMDLDHPRIPYDGGYSLHPMWDFGFLFNEGAIRSLQILLDHGLSAAAAGESWRHKVFDLLNVECGDPNDGGFWSNLCTWTVRELMLCASYEHIWRCDEYLRRLVGGAYNCYDLCKFRKWEDFYYEFDTSRCDPRPELYRCVIKIFEKKSETVVWRFGIGLNEGEF